MIKLPLKFEEILNKDANNYYKGAVYSTCHKFDEIFSENRLYFFEEYTDHGIRHINSVLEACERLITPETYKLLSEKDISILVLSVFLHDLGMHLQPLTFHKMITEGYDDVLNSDFGDQSWSVLWENYLFEAKKFNDQQRKNIFGDVSVYVTEPDFSNPDTLTGIHRKLIGEFIRRHHPRIAYEVAFKGLTTHNGTQIDFCADFDYKHKLLAGLLARSHGMNIRGTFSFLEKHFTKRVWRRPMDVHIVYLMAILRLADYFQIDNARVLKIPYLTRKFQSPVSFAEHQRHLQTTYIQEADDDPETLYITAEPANSTYFLAIENLFSDIQKEVDNSWAVLGEVYGLKSYDEQPKLAYRRVRSNIDDKKAFDRTVPYVPERISFTVDKEVPKLLVGPLYDYNPSFGVRELLQNAVDACWEREYYEKKQGKEYAAAITVKLEPLGDQYLFSIVDNGKGMSLNEIKDFFLKIGGSFRKSTKWQHDHIDEEGHSIVNKSGRFGIGVLAAYLLGAEIEVKTKSILDSTGYKFKTTLEQAQVEIIKDSSLSVGTVIEVIMPRNIINLFKSDSNDKKVTNRYTAIPRLNDWYALQYPQVNYQINKLIFDELKLGRPVFLSNRSVPSVNDIYDENWHEIYDKDYKRIIWSYIAYHNADLICNGFVVPEGYRLSGRYFAPPVLVIFDFDAKLPLSLNRNSVSLGDSFICALEKDIFKDFISKLLLTDVKNVFQKGYLDAEFKRLFRHPLIRRSSSDYIQILNELNTLIYCKSGFVINHPIFLNQLNGSKYLRVFLNDANAFSRSSGKKDQYLNSFNLDAISAIEVSSFVRENHVNGMYRHLIAQIGDNIIGMTDDIINLMKGNDEVKGFKKDEDKNLVQFFKNFDKSSLIYSSIKVKAFQKDLFSEVVLEYLGEDLLIPYNIEDRKKKFPKAFKELEPYMRKYLEKK